MANVKVSLEKLLESGAHFGHQSKRWNPKMEPYLYGSEGGVSVFDLTKTKTALEEALEVITTHIKEDKTVLLLGTKKQVKDRVKEIGAETGINYVSERWLGGTLTNISQIKKSISKLEDMTKKMASGEYAKFTKKERLLIEREIARLERFFGGVKSLTQSPDLIIIIDTHKESSAVREAVRMKVPIVGVVDSNGDPTDIDWVIPMNDDAANALNYAVDLIREAILAEKEKIKMAKITADLIRKVKEETGAPVMRAKKVLEELKGNEEKAIEILRKEGFEKAAKREGRATSQGKVFAYAHHTGKVVGVVELLCETDFVARNELFEILGKVLAMQVASIGEKDFESQEFIKDPSKKVTDLIKEVIAKTGENIRLGKLFRVELGNG